MTAPARICHAANYGRGCGATRMRHPALPHTVVGMHRNGAVIEHSGPDASLPLPLTLTGTETSR
jgi:hypothetical protein